MLPAPPASPGTEGLPLDLRWKLPDGQRPETADAMLERDTTERHRITAVGEELHSHFTGCGGKLCP